MSQAQSRSHKLALQEAARLHRERRGPGFDSGLTGAQGVAKLLKLEQESQYMFQASTHNQIDMIADAIDEPPEESPAVDMLSALPLEERQFYSCEENIFKGGGSCSVLFQGIQTRLWFCRRLTA